MINHNCPAIRFEIFVSGYIFWFLLFESNIFFSSWFSLKQQQNMVIMRRKEQFCVGECRSCWTIQYHSQGQATNTQNIGNKEREGGGRRREKRKHSKFVLLQQHVWPLWWCFFSVCLFVQTNSQMLFTMSSEQPMGRENESKLFFSVFSFPSFFYILLSFFCCSHSL